MSSTDVFLAGADAYNNKFDAEQYLKDCYQLDQDVVGKDSKNWMVKWLTQIHKVFAKGNLKGKKLLELGAGPCIYATISASKHYDEIVTSDYVKGNREQLTKWRNNDHDCFDWNPHIQIVCDLEGNGETAEERAKTLRERIVDVAFCDALKDPMLPSRNGEKYDAIVAFGVVEEVAPDRNSWLQILACIVKYLNPGGVLLLGNSLGSTFYRRGASNNRAFACYKTDRDEVISTLEILGTTILYESMLDLPGDGYFNDRTDKMFVVAQK
ncbi:nicotinamide N-methyltransferase-like [Amphiura filiformis]|uniref:nicotinamide N-methyltransferase-like n=1 Tax=Amphiura filiformis TaxID=82378 RepID=UPI003B21349A